MGIDLQRINQGNCLCGECMKFVKGGGMLCGYYECAPVRHKELADANSEAKQTAHNEQENQPKSSIWKDVSLGWIPDPKDPFWQNSASVFGQLVQSKTASIWNLPGKENIGGIKAEESQQQGFVCYFHQSSSSRKIHA